MILLKECSECDERFKRLAENCCVCKKLIEMLNEASGVRWINEEWTFHDKQVWRETLQKSIEEYEDIDKIVDADIIFIFGLNEIRKLMELLQWNRSA